MSTIDGLLFAFEGEEYSLVTDDHGERFLRGKGKKYRDGQSEYQAFEGDIPLAQIGSIARSETTPMFYITIGMAALAVAMYLILALSLNGRGFGG